MNKQISSSLNEGRFILIRNNTKVPAVEKGIDWNTKLIDYQTANNSLENFNVALVCGKGNIICIDCDNNQLSKDCEELLPKTYSEITCSGGYHYFYILNEEATNCDITSNGVHFGEIRVNRQYVVIAPSRAINKQGSLSDYKINSEVETLPVITKEQVKKILMKYKPVGEPQKSTGKISSELLNKINSDEELKNLYETEFQKGERSEAEQQLVDKLVARDFTKEEIYSIMGSSKIGKWNKRPISYRELTYNKAVQFVITQKIQKSKKELPPLNVMTIKDYEKYKPDKNYIIQGLKYPSESGLVYAPSSSGKSLCMLYEACCIATGKKYLNKFKVKQQPVLILSAENRIETDKIRLKKILRGLKSKKKNIPLYILPRNECDDILDLNFQIRLEKFIEDNKIKVLYLDTINPLTPEIDDNKGKDVTLVFNKFIKPICDKYHTAVYFLHHTQKTEGSFLGSIKWKANSDSVWRIDRKGLDNKFKIYNEKSRDGETEVLLLQIDFEETEFKFNLLGSGKAEIFSKKKKMSQQEFFILKLNELFSDKDTERGVIQETFTKHKIRYSSATLDRAIREWRGDNQ